MIIKKKNNFTHHAIEDRMGRYVFIAQKVGFGSVALTVPTMTEVGKATLEITTTGVIIIRGYENIIITMYIATLAQIKRYYGKQTIPRDIIIAAKYNEKHNFIELQDKQE